MNDVFTYAQGDDHTLLVGFGTNAAELEIYVAWQYTWLAAPH